MDYTSNYMSPVRDPPSPKIRMPVHNLSEEDLRLEQARHTYQHFHSPYNHHNRFMASVTYSDKYFLRDFERFEPYATPKSDLHTPKDHSKRPSSAPTKAHSVSSPRKNPVSPRSPGAASAVSIVAPNGSPCYSVQAKIKADVIEGKPLDSDQAEYSIPAWRTATVETYATPPARYGFGATGTRPFHQDYRHYKYYGFAGKGAKTSWAHNPKQSMIASPLDAIDGLESVPPAPLQEHIGGPHRELTTVERQLMKEFRKHTTEAPSSPTPASPRKSSAKGVTAAMLTAAQHKLSVDVAEPILRDVDIESREVVPASPRQESGDWRHARVMTYRQPAESVYVSGTLQSPQHGAQTPYVKRYQHYKYNGFAGKGATSSWARNPKYALLDD